MAASVRPSLAEPFVVEAMPASDLDEVSLFSCASMPLSVMPADELGAVFSYLEGAGSEGLTQPRSCKTLYGLAPFEALAEGAWSPTR